MFMELTEAQIKQFKKLHEKYGGLNNYSEAQIREIANGVANYYLTLFKIYQRIKKEKNANSPDASQEA